MISEPSKETVGLTPETPSDYHLLGQLIRSNDLVQVWDSREPLDLCLNKKIPKELIRLSLRVVRTYLKEDVLVIAGLITGNRYHHYHARLGARILLLRRLMAPERIYLETYGQMIPPMWVLLICCDQWVLAKFFQYSFTAVKRVELVTPTKGSIAMTNWPPLRDTILGLRIRGLVVVGAEVLTDLFGTLLKSILKDIHFLHKPISDFTFLGSHAMTEHRVIRNLLQFSKARQVDRLVEYLRTVVTKLRPGTLFEAYRQACALHCVYLTMAQYSQRPQYWQSYVGGLVIAPPELFYRLGFAPGCFIHITYNLTHINEPTDPI